MAIGRARFEDRRKRAPLLRGYRQRPQGGAGAQADRRVALVIGNGHYANVPAAANPPGYASVYLFLNPAK